MTGRYIAADLGSESGRVHIGSLGAHGLEMREVHRFPNTQLPLPSGLHVNILQIFADVLRGIEAALALPGAPVVSVGVDSWGVDYGLFDAGDRLLGNPYFYRDARTDGMVETFAEIVSPQAHYERTGIGPLQINTIYQLAAQARDDALMQHAKTLLMIPDIMHFWLAGERAIEYSDASTTGALGIDGKWDDDLIAATGAPRRIFANPIEAGTTLGPLRSSLNLGPRSRDLRVVVPATHDTACAIVAAPIDRAPRGQACAFISSGTWSLLGLELRAPILSEAARLAGFTNERGVGGSITFLRNIMGLWLVQESRRAWNRAGAQLGYDELTAHAAALASPALVIDVDDPALLHPADMPAAIVAQLAASGRHVEPEPALLTRAIFESLALAYRRSIADAERLAGVRVGAIAVVGGGARNALLCQLTADACERIVYAGASEASATGNILLQAAAAGEFAGPAQIRAYIDAMGETRAFEPRCDEQIDWTARDAMLTARRTERAASGLLAR